MQHLRNAKLIARFVLVWFALSIGVAIASPMVSPKGVQLICSGAGAIKIVVVGDEGSTPARNHTLDCPMCASTGAPPPMAMVAFGAAMPPVFAVPVRGTDAVNVELAAPPPARGPPTLS